MRVKDGYDGKETNIHVSADQDRPVIELWIEQTGEPRFAQSLKTGKFERVGHSETLSYMTYDEAITLRDELNQAIHRMVSYD